MAASYVYIVMHLCGLGLEETLRVLQCRFELRLVEEESLAESLFSLLCFLWQLPCPFVVVILANMWDWALIATLPFFLFV